MPHECHISYCKRIVAPRLLMCAPHWRKVPRGLQVQVYTHYRPGQEIDKRPTDEYRAVAQAAIEAVEKLEGRV